MTTLARRRTTSPLTEIFDWFEAGWPTMLERHRDGIHAIRIEDRVDDDRYVIKAELPGIDPEKVKVTVTDGMLSIEAERQDEVHDNGSSEFRYGSFMRSVTLPDGADQDHMVATYENGILEVVVPLSESKHEPRTIPVSRRPAD
jgi:HSP20 family molecular chaperone IbpA